jgi:glucans biosynthesis protein
MTPSEPIDLRLYLRVDGRPLTETWIYQWTPPSLKEAACADQGTALESG